MSDAWDAFVASINVADLERERFRPPAIDERPGSRADHEVRHAHAFVAADYWRKARGEQTEERSRRLARRIAQIEEQQFRRALDELAHLEEERLALALDNYEIDYILRHPEQRSSTT